MKTKSQKVDSNPPLRETEWGFKEDTLPDWQVRFCVNYEYARESKEYRLGVEEIRSQKPPGRGQPFNLLEFRIMSKTCWVLSTFLARSVPEFPGTPWLEIKRNRRVELLAKIAITEHTPVAGLGFHDRGHPEDYFERIAKGKTLGCIDENASFVLEFNFREKDAFIKAGFASWLKSTRDALLALHHTRYSPYCPSKKRKGKIGNVSVYRQALKDLSLFRRRRADVPFSKSDPQNEKTIAKICRRARGLIGRFSDIGLRQQMGFVESLIEQPG